MEFRSEPVSKGECRILDFEDNFLYKKYYDPKKPKDSQPTLIYNSLTNQFYIRHDDGIIIFKAT